MKTRNEEVQEGSSLLDRLSAVEKKAGKQMWSTAIIAVLAALLGSGGVAGILSVTSQRGVQEADARLKEAEARLKVADASAKELQNISDRHAKSIESLERIIQDLKISGKASKADAIKEIMLQQEADFQVFLAGMRRSMRELWQGDFKKAGHQCDTVLAQAQVATSYRYDKLHELLASSK